MGRHAGDRQQTSRHGPSAALADLFLLGAASSDLTEPGLREGDKSGKLARGHSSARYRSLSSRAGDEFFFCIRGKTGMGRN